jgi:hypothetical protein
MGKVGSEERAAVGADARIGLPGGEPGGLV